MTEAKTLVRVPGRVAWPLVRVPGSAILALAYTRHLLRRILAVRGGGLAG
jgi:hypothetical protein